MKNLSHIDENGKAAMVDVGNKPIQQRIAKAHGKIFLQTKTLEKIKENQIKKGDVLTVAQIAGIQAAKKTAHLIPLCHQINLSQIAVNFKIKSDSITAESEVSCYERTGAEMEALIAVNIALLTIYDMCKAIDKSMLIGEIALTEKHKI